MHIIINNDNLLVSDARPYDWELPWELLTSGASDPHMVLRSYMDDSYILYIWDASNESEAGSAIERITNKESENH